MSANIPFNRDALKGLVRKRRVIYDYTLKLHHKKQLVDAAWVEIAHCFIEDWADADFCRLEWERMKGNRDRRLRRHKAKQRSGAAGGHLPFDDDLGWLDEVGRDMTAVRVSNLASSNSSMRFDNEGAGGAQQNCCEAVQQAIERRDEELQHRPPPAAPLPNAVLRFQQEPSATSSPAPRSAAPASAAAGAAPPAGAASPSAPPVAPAAPVDLRSPAAVRRHPAHDHEGAGDEPLNLSLGQDDHPPPPLSPIVNVVVDGGRAKRIRRGPEKFTPSPLAPRRTRRMLDTGELSDASGSSMASMASAATSTRSAASAASAASASSLARRRKDRRTRRRATLFQPMRNEDLSTIHECDTVVQSEAGGDNERLWTDLGVNMLNLSNTGIDGGGGQVQPAAAQAPPGEKQPPRARDQGATNQPAGRAPPQPRMQQQPAPRRQRLQDPDAIENAGEDPGPPLLPPTVRQRRQERVNARQEQQRAFHQAHEVHRQGIRANMAAQVQARRAQQEQQENARPGNLQESAEVVLLRQFLTERTRDGVDYFCLSIAQQIKQLPPAVVGRFMTQVQDMEATLLRYSPEQLEGWLNDQDYE